MNLLKCSVELTALFALLSAATVSATPARNHPPVAAAAGCVTRQCHAARLESAAASGGGSVHPPAATGDCASCHDVALRTAHFVKGAPSGEEVGGGSARAWDLALCSECHGERPLGKDGRGWTTGFADGARNLHALHAQAGLGGSCLPCHDPHAARQPKLLRERIPTRGGARIAQQFRGEPQGGRCTTGCHAPKRYRR